MLLGERLGGRHQRSLAPRLDRAQQRVERDHRLPRADVALQQAPHRLRPGEVGVDLRDRLLLVRGELERERRPVALDQLSRGRECGRRRRLALGRLARERELEREQLVEREALPALLGLLERAWPVERDERVRPQRQPPLRP